VIDLLGRNIAVTLLVTARLRLGLLPVTSSEHLSLSLHLQCT